MSPHWSSSSHASSHTSPSLLDSSVSAVGGPAITCDAAADTCWPAAELTSGRITSLVCSANPYQHRQCGQSRISNRICSGSGTGVTSRGNTILIVEKLPECAGDSVPVVKVFNGSVVRMSVCSRPTFPDLRLIHG